MIICGIRSRYQVRVVRLFIGERNEEVLCGELGLSRADLAVLAEGGVV